MGEPRSCGAPVIGLGGREALQGNQPKIRRCDDAHSNAAHLLVPAASRSGAVSSLAPLYDELLGDRFFRIGGELRSRSFEDNWRARVALIEETHPPPNLFADTSGVRFFDLVADAVRRAGAHKIIFGSDGPFLHPGVELAKIDALKLVTEDEAKVLGGNISRLIGRNGMLRPAFHSTTMRSPP
jgi:hypothetical protein